MRELVDEVHQHIWEFAEQCGIEVNDPAALRRHVHKQLSSAMMVLTPAEVSRIGYKRLATLIDTADRYGLTLGEVLHHVVDEGFNRSATVAQSLYNKKNGESRRNRRSHLSVVK